MHHNKELPKQVLACLVSLAPRTPAGWVANQVLHQYEWKEGIKGREKQ